MAGPAEHFQTKWGQAYVVGVICPHPHLHLIFEISSLKNQFRPTGFFCRFRTRFLLPLLGKTVIVEPNQSVKHELKMCAHCLSTSFLSDLFT